MRMPFDMGLWGGRVALALALLVAAHWVWTRWGRRIHSRERRYEMAVPFGLIGRPDLVMQEWGGLLVVHDLKTRRSARVYPSDKLQLALYALLLRRSTGRAVANYAIVRLAVQGGPHQLKRVELDIEDAELERLHAAFASKAAAPATARMTAPPYLCGQCGFNGRGCVGKAPRRA